MLKRLLSTLAVIWLLSLALLHAQEPLTATVVTLINVRSLPDQTSAKIGELVAGQSVLVAGRNRLGDWLLIQTDDQQGWVASRYVRWSDETITLESLPVRSGNLTPDTPPTAPSDRGSQPASGAAGTSKTVLNVRVAPLRSSSALSQLSTGQAFTIEARSADSDWLLVNTGALRGWVAATYVRTDADLNILPVSSETIGQAASPAGGSVNGVPLTEGDAAIAALLQNTPVVSGISANAVAIYQRGVAQGRNPNYFMKIGDSNSASLAYLGLLGTNAYNLGSYSALQPTIDFFKQRGNSWLELSQVAQTGNLTTTIIDPIFTQPGRCGADESPLVCEIRVQNPAIALIYLGAADNQRIGADDYRAALRQIVERCINENVLPILTTMPTRPHPVRPETFGLTFNAVIVQVAAEYDIPLLNMWAATRGLPDEGMQGDLLHFTITANYRFVDFRGDERQTGYTAWNLGVLQMLDAVRRAVGG